MSHFPFAIPFMSRGGGGSGTVTSAGIPDPYTPPDGDWDVIGSISATVDISAATFSADANGSAASPAFRQPNNTGWWGTSSLFNISVGGTNKVQISDSWVAPDIGSEMSLGDDWSAAYRWHDLWSDGKINVLYVDTDDGNAGTLTTDPNFQVDLSGSSIIELANSEHQDVIFNLGRTIEYRGVKDSNAVTFAAHRAFAITAPTIASDVTSLDPETYPDTLHITDSATLYIDNAPQAGFNADLDNTYAIWVDAGDVRFDGGLDVDGYTFLDGVTISDGLNMGSSDITGTRGYMLDLAGDSVVGTSGEHIYSSADNYLNYRSGEVHDFYSGSTLVLRFDSEIKAYVGIRPLDDVPVAWGNARDVNMLFSTNQTPDALVLGLDVGSNGFIICENADRGYDFAHGIQTNPTLWIQSANQSATEWMSFAHDQTDGVIATGAGKIKLSPGGTIVEVDSTYLAPASGGATSLGYSTKFYASAWTQLLYIQERSAAGADYGTFGQVWVHNDDPNELWFTDGDGGDYPISHTAIGEIYLHDGSTAQTLTTQGTFYKLTGFTADGMSHDTTVSHTSDHVQVTNAGNYYVNFDISFSGSLSSTFEVSVFAGASGSEVEKTNITLERKLGTGGDVGSASCHGFLALSASDQVEVHATCTDGASKDITPHHMNLSVLRV